MQNKTFNIVLDSRVSNFKNMFHKINEEYMAQLDEMKTEIKGMFYNKKDEDEILKETMSLKKDKETLEEEIKLLTEEIQLSAEESQLLEDEIKDLKVTLKTTNHNLKNIKTVLTNEQTANKILESQINKHAKEILSQDDTIASQEFIIRTLKGKLEEEKNKRINSINDKNLEIEQIQNKNKWYEQQNLISNEQIRSISEENNLLNEKITELKKLNRATKLKETNQELQKKIKEQEEKNKLLKEEIFTLKDEIKESSDFNSMTKEEILQIKEKLLELRVLTELQKKQDIKKIKEVKLSPKKIVEAKPNINEEKSNNITPIIEATKQPLPIINEESSDDVLTIYEKKLKERAVKIPFNEQKSYNLINEEENVKNLPITCNKSFNELIKEKLALRNNEDVHIKLPDKVKRVSSFDELLKKKFDVKYMSNKFINDYTIGQSFNKIMDRAGVHAKTHQEKMSVLEKLINVMTKTYTSIDTSVINKGNLQSFIDAFCKKSIHLTIFEINKQK